MRRLIVAAAVIFAFAGISVSFSYADDTSEAILKVLIKKGIITQKEVNEMKAEIAGAETAVPAGTGGEAVSLEEKVKRGVGKVKLSGVSYLQYRYEAKNEDNFNAFEVTRGYITLKGNIAENTNWRLTTDLTRKAGGDLEYRLKYAYLTLAGLIRDMKLRLGQTTTSWVDWEEHIWGYRMQGTIFADREGYLTSSDLGISALGKAGRYLEYAAMVSNGEGYHAAEANKYKTGDIRLTLVPFPDNDTLKYLKLTGYLQGGYYDTDEERLRAIAHISYKNDWLTLAGEYLYSKDPYARVSGKHPSLDGLSGDAKAKGVSVYGVLKLPGSMDRFSLIGRYDYLDPDKNTGNNGHYRYIYGLSYRLNDSVRFLVDNDVTNYDDGAGKDDIYRILAQTEVKF